MGSRSHREELYEAFSGNEEGVDERVTRGLDVGTSYLGLPFGFLTRIVDGTQLVVTATGDHPLLSPGESCPIEETYCRETVASEGPLAVQHAATSTAVFGAAFDRFDLGTYVGVTVEVDDEVYGTVCFAGPEGRDDGFSEAETMFVELFAELVENALKHDPDEPRVRVEARTTTATGFDGEEADETGSDADVAVDGGAWVGLTVADDGPGIAETEAAVVDRGEETQLEHGSGLGLWLVNWVVTRYGGSCQVEAGDGEGTTVTVRLPAIDGETPVETVARRPTVLFR